ncbi:aspartate aminotransferase [Bordetella pertussis]|nr:aspartate aminotransferase [Bordetella pertussis]
MAVIDGTPYGVPGTFRLSFAAALEDIQQGCAAIRAACERLA